MPSPSQPASRGRLIAAFAAVYLIWGSTYLAIRFAIETLPPFLMAGARFTAAGSILFIALRFAGAAMPTRGNWRDAAIVGALLLLGGNGGVVWAEQYVHSGTAALLVATLPIWLVVFDWMRGTGPRPALQTVAGMALGLLGILLLVGPHSLRGEATPLVPVLVLVGASMAWAWGSLFSRGARVPDSPMMATALQMLCGGALLLAVGTASGELAELRPQAVSTRSLLALLYLMLFGSIVAYSAYIWLLRHAAPAHVSTYAYVNPIVAVLLGWALADEPLTARVLAAAAVIVGGVAVIVTVRGRRVGPQRARGEPSE